MSRRALLNQSLNSAAPPSANPPGVWRMTQTVLALYLGCTPRDPGDRSRSR
ncbi:hypothetical protein [Brevundimonas sp.]|uniref:hypothetical protein n=1 Tax=Brevundimonas sp. TaxID=1871086 RepID=UPI002ED8FC55